MPTMASGTSAMIALAAGIATGSPQRDFQHAHAAGNESFGERHRVFKPVDGNDGDDTGLT